VTFSAPGVPPVGFHLTNTAPPGTAARIILPSPAQSTIINTAFSSPLSVQVVDSANNPVQGATVSFTPLVAFPSGATAALSASTDVTNAAGIAQAVTATANGLVGSYSVKVAVQSNILVPSRSIGLRNYAASPASIALLGGTPQSALVGTPFGQALRVVLTDDLGNPTPQVPVFFTPPASGPGAVLSKLSAVTDANGVAQVDAVANGLAGSYPVDAVVFETTVEHPIAVSFDLTNTSASILAVPTLSSWGMAALVIMLAVAGLWQSRR
jgi:hypothetical protein